MNERFKECESEKEKECERERERVRVATIASFASYAKFLVPSFCLTFRHFF